MPVIVAYSVLVDNSTDLFTGTAGTDDYGFADWDDGAAYAAAGTPPPDADSARVKALAAARWRRIVRLLCSLGSPAHLIVGSRGVGDVTTVPDLLRFEVAWPGTEEPRIDDRFSPGGELVGVDAVRRAVAEGLAFDFHERIFVWHPEVRPGPVERSEDVTVRTPLSGDDQTRVTTAEGAITVTRVV